MESVAECERARHPLGTRPCSHNPRRGNIFHVAFSLSVKETEGVETIVRSTCLPTAAKQSKRHTVSGRCEAAQGCQPQKKAPTGIIHYEINTIEMDHEIR